MAESKPYFFSRWFRGPGAKEQAEHFAETERWFLSLTDEEARTATASLPKEVTHRDRQ